MQNSGTGFPNFQLLTEPPVEQSTQTFIELRKLLENLPAMVFLVHREDAEEAAVVVRSEGKLAKELNWDTETLAGKPVGTAFGQQAISEHLEKAFKGKPQQFRVAISDKMYECRLEPFDEFGEINDVTGTLVSIEAQHAAELGNSIYEQALEELTEAVAILDKNLKITDVNQALTGLFGYSEPEMRQLNALKLLCPTTPEETREAIGPASLQGPWAGELNGLRKDGSTFPVELKTAPLFDENKAPIAVVGVFRNLTERKDLEAKKTSAESERRRLAHGVMAYAKLLHDEIAETQARVESVLPQSFIVQRSEDRLTHNMLWFSVQFKNVFIGLVEPRATGIVGTMQAFTTHSMLNSVVNDSLIFDPNRALKELDEKLLPLARMAQDLDEPSGIRLGFLSYAQDQSNVKFAGAAMDMLLFKGEKGRILEGVRDPLAPEYLDEDNYVERFFDPETVAVEKGDFALVFTRQLTQCNHPGMPDDNDRLVTTAALGEWLRPHVHGDLATLEERLQVFLADCTHSKGEALDLMAVGIRF